MADSEHNLKTLRQQAEELLSKQNKSAIVTSQKQKELILHELQVHQIELEMQNEELRESQAQIYNLKERYFDLYDLAPVGYCTIDENNFITEANLTLSGLFGVKRKNLLQKPITDFIIDTNQDIYYLFRKKFVDNSIESRSFELEMQKTNGSHFWVLLTMSQVQSQESPKTYRIIISDISERKNSEKGMRLAASVFDNTNEAIMITNANCIILDVNKAFTRITGFTHKDVVGKNPSILKSEKQDDKFYQKLWKTLIKDKCWSGEIVNKRKDGKLYNEILKINAVVDEEGLVRNYIALFDDNTLSKKREAQLTQLAHYDALTLLPNRALLSDRLHQGMILARRHKQPLVVVYLDLDGFKDINDNYGHEVGDKLLIILAKKMTEVLREGDTLSRIGGDEFVAILPDLLSIEDSIPLLKRLLSVCSKEYTIEKFPVKVSSSLGVTVFPQNEDVDPDQLLRQADQAMYQAKLSGKDRYEFFNLEQNNILKEHFEGLEEIKKGFENKELVLFYQPKINMKTGEVISLEALIRWQHSEKGLLSPLEFLPLIENHPISIDVGEWVIDTALKQINIWQKKNIKISVSVNVSAYQLMKLDFVDSLKRILAKNPNVDPSHLEIEILETSNLEDVVSTSNVIVDCQKLGVSFAVDDFGTGYSSLTYLRQLPIKLIKIDQSFVKGMLHSSNDLAIIESIINLSDALGHEIIAEGVETLEHGSMLMQLGCKLAQGYAISKPMPAEDFPAWLGVWEIPEIWKKQEPLTQESLQLLYVEVNHSAWIETIENILNKEYVKPSKPLDAHVYHFGRFLKEEGLILYGNRKKFHKLSDSHKEVHTLASELIKLHAKPHTPEFKKKKLEFKKLNKKIVKLLKALK